MGILQNVLAWLTPKPKRSSRKWDPQVNPIDTSKIAKELQLREEGARLGAQGVPLDSDNTLCGPEMKAVLAIEQARTDYIEWGQLRLKSLDDELTRLDITAAIDAAENSADEFERLAGVCITTNAAAINHLEKVATSREHAFERFRARHKRLELPHYLQGWQKLVAWAVALALVTAEALANTHFFAQGLSGGLLQGFAQAFLTALANVAICLAAGILMVKYVNHVNYILKLVGWLALSSTLASMVGLALIVAHYREALVKGLEDAESAAFHSLMTAPFGLTEVSSIYLIVVGIFFGLAALCDGYKMDDPYPGYGGEHRKVLEAVQAYTTAIDALHNKLEEIKSSMLEKIDFALSHSEAAIARYKNVISDKDRCRDDLSNMIKDSPVMLCALLAEFRTENSIARRPLGYATPLSFSITPSLENLKVPNFDTANDSVNLARQEALLSEFRSKAPQIRARIQSGYTSHFNSLHTLSSHFDGIGISSRMAGNAATSPAEGFVAAIGGGRA